MNSFFMATATVFSLAAPAMNPSTMDRFAIDIAVISIARGHKLVTDDLQKMVQNGKVKVHNNGVVQITYKTGRCSYSSTSLDVIKNLVEPSEVLTEQIGQNKIYHAAWYPPISGGSDADVSPTKTLDFDVIDRKNRIILLRDAIHKLSDFPEFRERISERIIDLVFKEPEDIRRREQMQMILVPLQAYLFNPGIMTHKFLLEGLRVYNQNERRGQRRDMAWMALHQWKNIGRKNEMKRWLDSMILSQSLHKMSSETYIAFIQKAESLGIYVPEDRVKNRKRNQVKFQPRMYVLFGFKRPYSKQEEKIILESGFIVKTYRKLLAQYHPDKPQEYPEVAKFWYQEVQDIYGVLQRRKKNFDKGMRLPTEHELYNTRTIQELFLDEEQKFGGYLEK